MVNGTRAPAMPVPFFIGSGSSQIKLNGWDFPLSLVQQSPEGIRTGYEVERATRESVFPFRLTSLAGGFMPTSGIYDAGQYRDRVFKNEGIMCYQPGIAALAYKGTAQAALDNIDISGFRAANKRVHSLMSTLGVSGSRLLLGIGTKVYIDTSTSNPALTLADDALTDSILSIANLKLNSVDYTAVSTDGTTNDTRGAVDVTAATPFSGGTELITHAHADDGFFAMDLYPTLGGTGWNVFVGILNQVNGVWCCESTATLPQTSSTLTPVVDTSTSGIVNTSNTVFDTGFKFPSRGVEAAYEGSVAIEAAAVLPRWNSLSNITANDDAMVTTDVNIAIQSMLCGWFTGFTIPESATITGYTIRYRRLESNASVNAVTRSLRLFSNFETIGTNTSGSVYDMITSVDLLGVNPADMDTVEWALAEEAIEDGGSTDALGVNLTPAEVNAGIGVALQLTQVAVASHNVSVDSMELKVHYRLPGTQLSVPTGGWQPGKAPHRPNRMCYISPITNELATVNKPRRAYFLDFEYDSVGDRVTGTLSMPSVQMDYIEDANWFQGGLAVCGANTSGSAVMGQQIKLIDDDNVTRDLGFPAVHGTAGVRVVAMFPVGAVLMYYVANSDSTDTQLWMYYNGRHHAFGALFSKVLAGAMATQPLAWAEKTIGTYQSRIYSVYPTTTNTSVIYQFMPPDPLNADPFLVNTTEVKQDGPLYVQTLELDILPEEANKTITALNCQSRRIDNNTSYGSLRVLVDTGGDTTIASAEIDVTFDAAAETFVDTSIVSSGDPGVAFRSGIFRLIGNHEAGSAETPNLLPLLVYVVAQWSPLKEFGILLSREQEGAISPTDLATRLDSLITTKSVQRFQGNGYDLPVKVAGYNFMYERGSMGAQQPSWHSLKEAVVKLAQVPGSTS